MALFCVVIRRDSVSLSKFPFHGHIQVFSWEISPVCRLKYPYSCFSFHFSFLVFTVVPFVLMLLVLLLAVVISLSWLFLMYSARPRIDATTLSSMLVSPLPSPFLDTYNLCYLSGVRPCALLSTFVFSASFVWVPLLSIWTIVPSIFQEELPMCFSFNEIYAAELGFEKLSLKYSFLIFFLSSPFVWWCPLPIFPSTCNFPFLQAFRFFLDLVVLFLL